MESVRHFTRYVPLAVAVISLVSANATAQIDSLKHRIFRIAERAPGKVGVALRGPGEEDTLAFNGNGRFAMQSVYKFPLALAVLNRVDEDELSLTQRIHVAKSDLRPNTWSPLRERYPDGAFDITLSELLVYTVSLSDNNGCDILFRLLGGPKTVERYVHSLGVRDIAVATTEEEMHENGEAQWKNWSSPAAMAELLLMFDRGEILSRKTREFLWLAMAGTSLGPRRIKGLLPEGTIVAHKTGSSGTDDDGMTVATNDAGIVTLPDGRHLILVVFVSNAKAPEVDCERVIAETAKAVWDSYSRH